MAERIHVGASFPLFELYDPGAVKAFAQAADSLGYDFISSIDHILGVDKASHPNYEPYVGSEHYLLHKPFHEIITLLSFLAGCTEHVRLMTTILILPQRQTALVAKQAAEVDILSKGRLTLGVAVGHSDLEYKGLDIPFASRGARIEEQVHVLRMLWTQPVVHFKGRFHDLDGVGINPLPVQRPIPLWMGGWTETVLARTAKLADGGVSPRDPGKLLGYVKRAGRDPKAFPMTGGVEASAMDNSAAIESLRAQAARGITHIRVSTEGLGPNADRHIAALRKFKQDYKP